MYDSDVYLANLPELIDRWAADMDRMGLKSAPATMGRPCSPAPATLFPGTAARLEQWAADMARLWEHPMTPTSGSTKCI